MSDVAATYAAIAGSWVAPPAPQVPAPRRRNETPPVGTDAILAPVDAGLYSALTLLARASPGGLWTARFEIASSADGFATWTPVGYGSQVASGASSSLELDLGPLSASLTYKIRFTAYDASGAAGATTTEAGTFSIDHVARPTPTTPAAGALLDSTVTQTFTWTFNDPDSGHAQTAYALRRVRQPDGATRWWRASDSSWQTIETWNLSATGSAAIGAAAWQTDGLYSWSVATKDTPGLPSAYTDARTVQFSAGAPGTIVTPPSAGNLVTQSVTVVWTCSEQTRFRVRLLTGGGFTTVLADSGVVADPAARSYLVAGAANGTTVRVELTTYNNDLLPTVVTRDKSVVYTGPTAPTAVGTGLANPPRASLAITNPGGGDPFASNSILRSDDGGVTYATIATGVGASATYVDHGVGAGTTHSYKIRAYGTGDTFTDSAVI